MARRVVVGIALAVVGLGAVVDLRLFTVLVVLIACGALQELYGLAERNGARPIAAIALGGSIGYLLLAMLGLLARFEGTLLGAVVMLTLLWSLYGERRRYLLRSSTTIFAILYIGKLLSYLITIRREPQTGAALTVFVIVLIAFTDIFAMLVGKRFGRTVLTSISPAKTVEGAVGGLAAALFIGIVFVTSYPAFHLTAWQGACIGMLTSIAAQLGDLVESALKRDALVKDAGTILRSHGGVLDRFDSYLFGGIGFYMTLHMLSRLPSEYH